MYSSNLAPTEQNSFACAHWLKSDAGSIDTSATCQPGCVQFYIKHNVRLGCNDDQFIETFYLGYVRWYVQGTSREDIRTSIHQNIHYGILIMWVSLKAPSFQLVELLLGVLKRSYNC